MNHRMRLTPLAAAAALALAAAPAAAHAQASNYPAWQPPRITSREYNFGFAAGDNTRSLVFQWREAWTPISQLSLDAGVTDFDNVDINLLFVGGQYARQLARASADVPLDFLFTLGANVGFYTGDIKPADALIRVPVGVVIGRRFALDQAFAITPYVHPRASLDFLAGDDNPDNDDTNVAVNFDLGADFEMSRRLSVRLSALLGDDDAIGISLAFTPPAVGGR